MLGGLNLLQLIFLATSVSRNITTNRQTHKSDLLPAYKIVIAYMLGNSTSVKILSPSHQLVGSEEAYLIDKNVLKNLKQVVLPLT